MSNQFLSKEEMLRLGNSELKSDRMIVASYIISGRLARAVQEVFDTLEITPEYGLQTKVCEIIYNNMFLVPQEDILAYIETIKDHVELNSVGDQFFTDKDTGHC
jgi:hypothetical protein